ncbi:MULTISPECIES: Lrp/AsnC family transcriptional regulator [unclassified Pedobacter]|uniref:Lrp/AsnC family transcriptional regulator n=1 Tax=unclassified Pedobacter TaxID=2628915 RepID=UPI000B4AB633|nr:MULTISPECIES: Lrp/AsnC ligand binding domain-containing protein [unclassified Pedobacter]MCX2430167.1 Lrp/AsnC ligand binding domain-containing protein [Pedobacter sp. GR22-10]OWK69009.1 AsnC family transcriptional regulator [Pedobacter sp. AJM]
MVLDKFDTELLKRLEKDGRIAFSTVALSLGVSNTMVHQRFSRLLQRGVLSGVKPVLNEKKMGFDWGSFTGLTLDKDYDSARVIEALREVEEVTECYFITGRYTLFIKIVARNHEHMREVLYNKIDSIPGIIKTDSIIELGCAFKRNVNIT